MVDITKKPDGKLSGRAFSISLALYLVLSLVMSLITKGVDDNGILSKALSYFLVSLSLFLASFISLKIEKVSISSLTNWTFDIKFLLVILLVFVGSFVGLGKLNDWFISLLNNIGYHQTEATLPEYSPLAFVVMIIFVGIIPPICEELLFRGVILSGLKGMGKVGAVLISATTFCIYHMSPDKTIYQLLIGVIYGIIAINSGSILPTMILHSLNNIVVICLYYFTPTFDIFECFGVIGIIIALLLLAGGLVIAILPKKKEEPINNKRLVLGAFGYHGFIGLIIGITIWVAQLITGLKG